MNIKLITKAMHTLSLLSEDDVQMVMKLRGLSEDERQMLMLVLEPGVKPSKKSSKKAAGGGGGRSSNKSARASGMAAQLNKSLQGQRATINALDDSDLCEKCGRPADDNIHHLQTESRYHPFVCTAQPAESSSNQATSETGKGAAGDAHHAASSGD